jgi:hypothetical protein
MFVAVRHSCLCRAGILCRALCSDFTVRFVFTVRAICRAAAHGNDCLHANALFPRSAIKYAEFLSIYSELKIARSQTKYINKLKIDVGN